MRLLVLAGEGQRETEPPQRVDEARDGHGDGDRKVGEVDEIDAEKEGDAAAHIPEGIALGGNVVEALGRRHVGEHGVVEDEADRIADLRDDEDGEEGDPAHRDAERPAPQNAQNGAEEKERLLPAHVVGERAQNGREHRDAQRDRARRIPPDGGGVRRREPCRGDEIVEVDGQHRAHEQRERRIAHVVQDPGDLLSPVRVCLPRLGGLCSTHTIFSCLSSGFSSLSF